MNPIDPVAYGAVVAGIADPGLASNQCDASAGITDAGYNRYNGAACGVKRFDPNAEWLEADGLGGFASGTVSGIRSRRYQALLLTATTPPAGRMVLVNGFDAWIETNNGSVALSSQRYAPDVIHPDGASRIESFDYEPFPRWRYRISDELILEQEIFVPHGQSAVMIAWRLLRRHPERSEAESKDPGAYLKGNATGSLDFARDDGIRLKVRPFLSGRDFHSTHHENGAFRFDAERLWPGSPIAATTSRENSGNVRWRFYDGVPAVIAFSNGDYAQEPTWYRNFLYAEELARGLDATEDLASPGVFSFSLSDDPAVLMLAVAGIGDPGYNIHRSALCPSQIERAASQGKFQITAGARS